MSPDIVWKAGADGVIDFISYKWADFIGIDRNDPDAFRWELFVHPDDLQKVVDVWSGSVERGETYELAFRVQHHRDGYHWVSSRSEPVRNEDGVIIMWYGTLRDIEDIKRAEHTLVSAAREKDEFLAILGHELRTPLSAIATGAELLDEGELSDGDISLTSRLINREVKHLTRLVDDLLDLSRLSTGKMRLQTKVVKLNSLLDSCFESVQSNAEASSVSLHFTPAAEEVYAICDEVRVAQCVKNLLNNAIKFSPEGAQVHLALTDHSHEVHISVKDFGIGIDKSEIETLFHPFKQSSAGEKHDSQGLGLGLSIVRDLITLHDGRVWAESDGLDKGSEFFIALHTCPPPEKGQCVACEQSEHTGTLSLLVVDDNKSVYEMMRMLFQLDGHNVHTADNGQEALDLAREHTFDAIFCDISMPGDLDGWDVAKIIRSEQADSPYLIALSGHTQKAHVTKSLEAGFHEHLAKPPSLNDLRACLVRANGDR